MSKIVDNIEDIETIVDKQDTLVSGENIKTINGQSIVGAGDVTLESISLAQVQATALSF